MEEQTGGQPIPFIINKEGEFTVTPEAETFLKSLSGRKMGVVCIVGKYRTGKSYLINKVILNRTNKDGFTVGPTVNPCTKGLWIWNQPIRASQPDGEDIDLIVMDCEGFGGMDESQNHDTRIFLFALLLSSYFVYNSVGSIDETALQTLSLVVNLAKDVRMKASDQDMPSEEDIAENFPGFLWVVRDFTLKMVDAHDNPLTSKQYLESALAQVKGNSEAIENKNRIRRLLKHFFRDRDCVTMVRPVETEVELQKLDSLSDKYLREEFLQQAQVVRNKIMKKTKTKSVGGKLVTSEMLLHLANGYAVAVNRGRVPTIESAWNYVCKEKANDTAKECLTGIDHMVANDQEIKALLLEDKDWKGEIKRRLIEKFTKAKFADGCDLKERQVQLEKEIDDKLENVSKTMSHQQTHIAERWLETGFEPLNDLIKQDQLNSPTKAERMLDELEAQFNSTHQNIPGRQREKLFRQFRQDKEARILNSIVRAREEETRREKERQLQQLQVLEKENAVERNKKQEEIVKLHDRVREMEEAAMNLRGTEMSLKEKLQHLQEKVEYEREKAAEREAMHKGSFEDMSRRYQADIDSFVSKLNVKEGETIKLSSEKEKLDMMLQQQKQLSQDAIETMKKRIAELETVTEAGKAREDALNLKIRELMRNEEAKDLKDQLEGVRSKKRLVENELGEMKVEKQYLENQLKFYKDQIDENKKLQDTLLGALQQQLKVDDDTTATELLATNKNLGTSLGKAEARIKALETKVERYKLYKQMVAGATAFQCKDTGKLIPKNAFLAHLQNLEKVVKGQGRENSEDSSSKNGDQIVKITQTIVKEYAEPGSICTEYLLQVRYSKGLWKVSRSYREFAELNYKLVQNFPSVKLPSSANQILGFGANVSSLASGKKKGIQESRRIYLEEYLNDLFRIPQIAASSILREFLKIDLYVGEGGMGQSDIPSKSPLRRDASICDITSAYKNTNPLEVDSATKTNSAYGGSEWRRERHFKENHSLINK